MHDNVKPDVKKYFLVKMVFEINNFHHAYPTGPWRGVRHGVFSIGNAVQAAPANSADLRQMSLKHENQNIKFFLMQVF